MGRNKGANPQGTGERAPKRQFDRHVSGTGRYKGEKKGGNTKFGSGEKSVTADQVPADAPVEEAAAPVEEEPKVVEEPEEPVLVLDAFQKSKVLVADDVKVARKAVVAATGANMRKKGGAVTREVTVTKPVAKKVDASKKNFDISEFQSLGKSRSSAPQQQKTFEKRTKAVPKKDAFPAL
jgi:hypothetical protein